MCLGARSGDGGGIIEDKKISVGFTTCKSHKAERGECGVPIWLAAKRSFMAFQLEDRIVHLW